MPNTDKNRIKPVRNPAFCVCWAACRKPTCQTSKPSWHWWRSSNRSSLPRRPSCARKDQIIEALQRRLFGRSSERLDPAQGQLGFDDATLGKPAPPPGDGRSTPEGEGEGTARRSRRKKAELFPENLRVVVDGVVVPDEVAADPGAFKEIGEDYHDELDITRARCSGGAPCSKSSCPKTTGPGRRWPPGTGAEFTGDALRSRPGGEDRRR